jgi:hypothetical protein
MSYLENGATHRSLFRLTPPLHHDVDPKRSQIVAYIMENTGWEVGRAVAAFNSMRNPRSRVLVFDKVHRVWKGCDWIPSKDSVSNQMILSEHRALERRVIAMDAELRKATREIAKLTKQLANLKDSVADRDYGDDDEQEETEEEYNQRRKAENEQMSREEAENERVRASQKAARSTLRNHQEHADNTEALVNMAWS